MSCWEEDVSAAAPGSRAGLAGSDVRERESGSARAGGAGFLMRASNAVKGFVIFCISRYDSEQEKEIELEQKRAHQKVFITL